MMVVGLISFSILNIVAQEKISDDKNKLQKTDMKNNSLQNYIKISSLPIDGRRKLFNDLSAEDKANLFKLHLTLQFIKHPNLTNDQKDIILDSISITVPDAYDKSKDRKTTSDFAQSIQARAETIFSRQEALKIFASLGGNQEDIVMLQKYQSIIDSPFRVKRTQDFSKLSPQEKSNTMKTHLIVQMVEKFLSKKQIEFILELFPLISSESYSAKKGTVERNQTNASLSSVSEKVLDFFQKEEAVRIFTSLGGEEGFEGTESASGLCSCSNDSDYCNFWHKGATCNGGGICEVTIGGCGFLLQYDCDGQCNTW